MSALAPAATSAVPTSAWSKSAGFGKPPLPSRAPQATVKSTSNVTRGRISLHTEFYAPEILEEGDGVYLDSTMGHAYLNAGDEPAKGVCLCTSESPNLYEQLRQIAVGK